MAAQSTLSGLQPGGPERGSAHDQGLAPIGPDYSVEPITTEEGLAGLERDWNRLYEYLPSPNVFMTFDWFRAWHERFARAGEGERRSLNVLVLRRDGAVAGITPLVLRTASRLGFDVRKLEFITDHSDYNDVALGNDPAGQTEAIAKYLTQTRNQWDLVDLRNLRETTDTLARVEGVLANTELHCHLRAEDDRYPYFPIDSPWEEMLQKFSPHPRHNFRTQQNRLDRLGAQGLRIRIIDNPHEEPGLLPKLIALESRKRVEGEPSEPLIAAHPQVFQSLFDHMGPRGWVYIAMMEMGGQPLAWRLGFRCGRKIWDYSTAYDDAFARLSPGTMLVPAVIDNGFSHGFTEYDFLRGDEPYKKRWATGFRQTFQLQIWNRRWTSRARAFVYLDLKAAIYRRLGIVKKSRQADGESEPRE